MSGIGLLLKHELRSVIRDRRTVVLSVLLPLLVMPLFLLASRTVEQHKEAVEEAQVHPYALVGEATDALAELIASGVESLPETERPQLEPTAVEDAAAALESEKVHAYVSRDEDTVEIHYRANKGASRNAADALEDVFEAARELRRSEILTQSGFPIATELVAAVETHDVADKAHVAGSTLSKFLTLTVVLLVLVGGQVVAADLIAGEKERGTLETLLTTAARREDIIRAKLLTILIVALAITAINLGNLLVYASFGVLPGADALTVSLPPLSVLALALAYLPVALLIAAMLLLLSGYARSYKEAQLYMVPLQLLLLAPAAASLLPNLELRSAVVAVPIANASVATREILTGHYDWLFLAAMVAVNLGAGLWLSRLATRAMSQERLVTPSALESAEHRGGPELFVHHVPRWAAGLWAALLIVSLNFPDLDIRAQLGLNLIVGMLGVSVIVARRYRLDIRKVWALRRPPPIAWLAVAIAVPSGLVVGHGVFELSSLFLPVPEKALARFSEVFVPDDVPKWQLLAMASVLPGICEEIFFRGTLLHGLRKRFHPVVLCLVVGLVFGIFHVALFRIFPTAFLGVCFAAVTLLTGSIFPAMVWHALNNLTALTIGELGLEPTTLPPSAYAAATLVLALAFAILWRYRRPYPDLRSG